MNYIFVTGTDTGVGKTVISFLLMDYFSKKNKNAIYLKLIQTGCDDLFHKDSDAYFVYKNLLGDVDRKFLADKICYLFKNPKAPYFAAIDENKEIDIDYLQNWVNKRSKGYDNVIIEGAGGLMVPIWKDFFVVDFIKLIKAKVILVGRPCLGTINHTLLSIEALKNRNIPIKAVILSMKEQEDKELIEQNIKAIYDYSKIKVFLIEEIKDPITDSRKYFDIMEQIEW
ncbi:dethiobiotin synthase [Desulfothermus sp.]